MPEPSTVARIVLWHHAVGAVAELGDGRVIFEYEPAFARSGLEISPVKLPLSLNGPVSFPELARVESFGGLPGVLADALPDAFGNAVIRRYFEARGTPNAAFSPVQKLLYIGQRAMGALEFLPPLDVPPSPNAEMAIEVARLVAEARRVIAGDPVVAVPEMMQSGASAGGARAKATILWNREQNEVRSAFATRRAGDEHWLIKFDGVSRGGGGHGIEAEFQAGPWGRIEYAYSVMARAAGIEMMESQLLREREFAHFLTKRFDRVDHRRLHLHSLGGLQHIDYNVRGAFSYEGYFRTIRQIGLGQPSIDEAFRRMTFNLAARNQDDHVKNLGFVMDANGDWRLAPAFDLTWAMGGQWARTHQMTARGKDDEFTRDDLLAIGREFDVAKGGAGIIEQVDAALAVWPTAAREAELDATMIDQINASFRRFR
jgi:serine/threonine-protein kinase HipA